MIIHPAFLQIPGVYDTIQECTCLKNFNLSSIIHANEICLSTWIHNEEHLLNYFFHFELYDPMSQLPDKYNSYFKFVHANQKRMKENWSTTITFNESILTMCQLIHDCENGMNLNLLCDNAIDGFCLADSNHQIVCNKCQEEILLKICKFYSVMKLTNNENEQRHSI